MGEAFDVADRGRFTTAPARSVTCCRTICCRSSGACSPSRQTGLAVLSAEQQGVRDRCPAAATTDDVVKGQCAGYREVEGVDTDSTTETYVAARAMLD
jgi:glucose-6-phosphate 1-dehydrogenase